MIRARYIGGVHAAWRGAHRGRGGDPSASGGGHQCRSYRRRSSCDPDRRHSDPDRKHGLADHQPGHRRSAAVRCHRHQNWRWRAGVRQVVDAALGPPEGLRDREPSRPRHTAGHLPEDSCTAGQHRERRRLWAPGPQIAGSPIASCCAASASRVADVSWSRVFQVFAADFSALPLNLYQNFQSQPRLRRMQTA